MMKAIALTLALYCTFSLAPSVYRNERITEFAKFFWASSLVFVAYAFGLVQ